MNMKKIKQTSIYLLHNSTQTGEKIEQNRTCARHSIDSLDYSLSVANLIYRLHR